MTDHPTRIRAALAAGPLSAGELRVRLDVSRPTLARALATLPDEIVTWGSARATQYALRDRLRDLPDMPVYRVSERGRITLLGRLIPVRPDATKLGSPAILSADALPIRIGVAVVGSVIVVSLMLAARSLNQRQRAR